MPKSQFELLAAFIEGKIFDKTMAKWQFYKKSSGLFSRYLRPVMLSVGFELADSKSNVIELIKLLKTHYSKRKNPAALMVKISSDIGRTVPKWLIPYINNNSNLEYFDPYRLEFYVYWRMSHYITKGRLVCNDSVSYGDLDQDLIPEYLVDNVEEIAAKFGYLKIPIYCDARLDEALARN